MQRNCHLIFTVSPSGKKLQLTRGCEAPPKVVKTKSDFKVAHNNGGVDGMIS
jgi:hypothetical protein